MALGPGTALDPSQALFPILTVSCRSLGWSRDGLDPSPQTEPWSPFHADPDSGSQTEL